MSGMSQVVIQAPQKTQSEVVQSQPKPKIETQQAQDIDNQMNAKGRKNIAEKAMDKAINAIAKKLAGPALNVSKILDSTGGIKAVSISDSSGNKIADMPPKAVLAIAERAKEMSIGLMVDQAV